MNNLNATREKILAAFETLRGLSHVPGEYLSFRIELYQAQAAAAETLDPGPAVKSFPLTAASLKPDPAVLARIIDQAVKPLRENRALKTTLEKLAGQPRRLPEIAAVAALGSDLPALERLAGETGATLDELAFIGRALAAPYVTRSIAAAQDSGVEADLDSRPCPWCGSEPGLSIVRGEAGSRFLVCSLCGLEWGFMRSKCPFCEAENTLQIITEGPDHPRRLEICSTCKGYIKSIDQRRLGNLEMIPLVEAVGTLYLDLIAAREGALPGLPYVALR